VQRRAKDIAFRQFIDYTKHDSGQNGKRVGGGKVGGEKGIREEDCIQDYLMKEPVDDLGGGGFDQ